jgi:hypothetical protein
MAGSSPPSLAQRYWNLKLGSARAGVILKGSTAGNSPPSLAPKVQEFGNRLRESWCHSQRRLRGSPGKGGHRRLGSKGAGTCKQVRRGLVSYSTTFFWQSTEGRGSARAGVILNDVVLEVHGGELRTVTCKYRFGQGWCHTQGRLLRGPRQEAHRRPWLQRYWNL